MCLQITYCIYELVAREGHTLKMFFTDALYLRVDMNLEVYSSFKPILMPSMGVILMLGAAVLVYFSRLHQ